MLRQIELDETLANDALSAATEDGLSLQEWVKETLQARLATEQEATDYFRKRRDRATGDTLRRALNNVPDNPPDPGDQW